MKFTTRFSVTLLLLLLASCISYEPVILRPAITLSAEEVELVSASAGSGVDFGMDVSLNESDSLFNVETLPGVRLRAVNSNGPAANAGLEIGDVILRINGTQTDHPDTLLALQANPVADNQYTLEVRRGTLVFEASMIAAARSTGAPPRELYRVDPIASRAGYRTELVNVPERGMVAAARVMEIFAESPLPAAGIEAAALILALNGRYLDSAQDLVNRLNTDFEPGDTVQMTVVQNERLTNPKVELWNPGRRISRIALGPVLQYESSLSPVSSSFTLVDLWLFALYRFQQNEGERSHSILGLINVSTDVGELIEETNRSN